MFSGIPSRLPVSVSESVWHSWAFFSCFLFFFLSGAVELNGEFSAFRTLSVNWSTWSLESSLLVCEGCVLCECSLCEEVCPVCD